MEEMIMVLKDYMDTSKLQELQNSFSGAAGLEAVVVSADGKRLTDGPRFRSG